jgi:hypothetical protein
MTWHRSDPREFTTRILRADGSSLVVAAGASDAELRLMIAAPKLRDALKAVVLQFGPWHDDDCPCDDTCDCSAKPLHDAINAALADAEDQ